MELLNGRLFQQENFFQRNRFHLWMSNGFSYKLNILYLNLKYGIIKKSQVQYLSFVRWIRFERKETDADGSFHIPILCPSLPHMHIRSYDEKKKKIGVAT